MRGHGTYPFPAPVISTRSSSKTSPPTRSSPGPRGLEAALGFSRSSTTTSTRGISKSCCQPRREELTAADGEVLGLIAETDGKKLTIKAKKGVILACGGYENDDAMKLQYFRSPQPVNPFIAITPARYQDDENLRRGAVAYVAFSRRLRV